jgi:AraC-like DNA-binding protein
VRRAHRQIVATTDELYCLARNVESHDAVLKHHGREFRLRPGSMALLRLDEPFLGADGTSHKRFTNINFPVAALRAMIGHIDDLIGCELAPGGTLTLAMDYCEMLLNHTAAVDQAGVSIASHVIDLISIGLQAHSEAAYMARGRGLREVRLQAVLMILLRRFSEPDFSARKLATAANLSERYVNELLHDAGASFHERINELRLRKALDMLAQPDSLRISDVAFACGFNDLSYFNRCFRRRFGLTPTAARGR